MQLHKRGLLKAIGVSNFTIRHIDELLADCGGVIPAVNQVLTTALERELEYLLVINVIITTKNDVFV